MSLRTSAASCAWPHFSKKAAIKGYNDEAGRDAMMTEGAVRRGRLRQLLRAGARNEGKERAKVLGATSASTNQHQPTPTNTT